MKSIVKSDITDSELEADTIIINSCTVTNSADSNLKSYISYISKNNPKAKILVTGCSAHSIGEELFKNKKIFKFKSVKKKL